MFCNAGVLHLACFPMIVFTTLLLLSCLEKIRLAFLMEEYMKESQKKKKKKKEDGIDTESNISFECYDHFLYPFLFSHYDSGWNEGTKRV